MVEAPEIAVLDSSVIDQIAAGEVIERPASVVKELVENALDAGARHITVNVEGGGKRLIRVVDDGCGMTGAGVRLALIRHATSKLRTLDDLLRLGTLGFRGEALPSIASVSRLTITTRTRGELAGTRLIVDAGTVVEAGEVGAAVGTVVEVRDLLYNVPARLKFMKGDATEASHVTDAVSKIAMANPGVHVRLKHSGRKAIDVAPHGDGFERARALLGARFGDRLHPARGEEGGVVVHAYLAAPELAQSTSRGVQLYVGRRPVRDRGLLHALSMGYGELIPRGRYPVAVVFVDLPGEQVDVNVHPQKSEVRFSDAQAVYAAVRHTVSRAVAAAPWLDEQPAVGSAPVRMTHMMAQAMAAPPSRASDVARGYAERRERSLFSFGGGTRLRAPSGWSTPEPVERRAAPRVPAPDPAPAPAAAEPSPDYFSRLAYIGQLDRTYLVCEASGELVLIDQHAAHERVAFQRLRERYAARAVPVQHLLFPQPLALDDAQRAAAQEARNELEAAGFALAGTDELALASVPAGLRGAEPAAVLTELLDELVARGGSRAVDERLDAVFATIACHSVVRAGDTLSPAEAEALLRSMDGVDFKAHCPHGRPVLLRISVSEIARRFGRT